jgi:hypothetical protein
MEVITKACPNARNFYPQGNGAIYQAIAEHKRRLEALESIRQEYEVILEGIYAHQRAIAEHKHRLEALEVARQEYEVMLEGIQEQ